MNYRVVLRRKSGDMIMAVVSEERKQEIIGRCRELGLGCVSTETTAALAKARIL